MNILKLIGKLWSIKGWIILSLLMFLAIGEMWMRLPFIPQRLEYEPDRELDGRLAPNQRGFMWMGEMSLRSPLITINSAGFRGAETDWNPPVILSLGGSDSFGSGVEDNEVWTAVLQNKIQEISGFEPVQVLNAAHPGHGPAHHLVRLERILKNQNPSTVIVRISVGMWNFRTPLESEKDRKVKMAETRKKIKKYTKFLPFVYNKLQMQLPSLRKAIKPKIVRQKTHPRKVFTTEFGETMWGKNDLYWKAMIDLLKPLDVPLVFCLWDIRSTNSAGVLRSRLEKMCADEGFGSVLYLGPESLGLNTFEKKYRETIFRERYTLRLDLHGNPLQHRAIARESFNHLHSEGLIDRLRMKT